jgi:hypothetical protein
LELTCVIMFIRIRKIEKIFPVIFFIFLREKKFPYKLRVIGNWSRMNI